MASVESGNYRKFDNTNKSSFKKHSHDKSGGYKRPYDGQSSHQQGGNKRFKGKYVPKPKKPVVLDKKDRQELRKRRRAAKPNAGKSYYLSIPFLFLSFSFPTRIFSNVYNLYFYSTLFLFFLSRCC